jgi:glyoxylate/hydroxypyruvate reductase A
MDRYDAQQRAAHWSVLPQRSAEARSIGIMGLGMIGQAVAALLVTMGFKVHGWSQTRKILPGVNSYVGEAELNAFLQNTEILVAVLPSTVATVGLIDARLLEQLPRGAFLINVGRGDLIREGDLLDALDREHLAGAALDVFSQEPLPVGHPFWRHPKVSITPHVASITQADTAVAHVVTNIGRWQAGQTLSHVVDVEQGY